MLIAAFKWKYSLMFPFPLFKIRISNYSSTTYWENYSSSSASPLYNCMYAHLGQILDKRYNETKKPNCHLWRAWRKLTALCMTLAHNTTKGCANHLNQPSGLTLEHTPTVTPYMEQVCAHSAVSEQASEPVVCSHLPCLAHPNKHLPEKTLVLQICMYLFLDIPSCHPVPLIYFSIILSWLLLFLLCSR